MSESKTTKKAAPKKPKGTVIEVGGVKLMYDPASNRSQVAKALAEISRKVMSGA